MFDSNEAREKMQKTVESLDAELKQIRAGRATPALVENLLADVYGSKMPINQLANINVLDAHMLVVQSWDKNNQSAIVKAINESNIGISPVVDGDTIRLAIPPLSEERREELVKSLGQIVERSRVSLRQIRKSLNADIEKTQSEKEITEDEAHRQKDQVQKLIDEFNKIVDEVVEKKTEELMTV